MLRLGRHPLRWSTAPPFDCFPPLEISLSRTSISQRYQIIFNASKTILHLPGIDMQKPRRNRPPTLTRNDKRSRITSLGTKFIWRPRIYDCGSRRKEGVLNFILAILGHSKSRRQNQLCRITLSNCHQNIESIQRFMLDD